MIPEFLHIVVSFLNGRAHEQSGLLGATASCTGKLSLDPKSFIPTSTQLICEQWGRSDKTCSIISFFSRVISFFVMLMINATMMNVFLDGMNESESVLASALSTGANFSMSVSQLICSMIIKMIRIGVFRV